MNDLGQNFLDALNARGCVIHDLFAALTRAFDLGIAFDAIPPSPAPPEPALSVKRKAIRRKTAKKATAARRVPPPVTADDRAPRQHAGDLTARRRLVLAQFKRHLTLTGKQLRKVVRFDGVADDKQAPVLQLVLTWLRLEGYIDRTSMTWGITDKGKVAEL